MIAMGSVATMRSWMRVTGGCLGVIVLYALYAGAKTLVYSGPHTPLPHWAGGLALFLAVSSLVPGLLIWRQIEAATRYLNEPTLERLQELTATIRRFWRLSGVVVVLQLTAVAVGVVLP